MFILNLKICIKKLNFSKLVKENFFIISNKLAFNKYLILITFLANTKANNIIFINL
jgi:hypothetical protein